MDPIPGVPVEARPLRIALYVLLALAAAAVLFLQPALAGAVQRGALPGFWLFLPMGLYGAFLLAYAVDRLLLVKRRGYPAGKAFFQIAFGVMFALMLLPSTIADFKDRQVSGVRRYLLHPDAGVRTLAVEALGFRGLDASRDHLKLLVDRLDDRDPGVRRAATRVLAGWSGKKPADVGGMKAWASELSGGSTSTSTKTTTSTAGDGT
jgi:hypothetical protein